MLVSEFINTMTFGILQGREKKSLLQMEMSYDNFFLLPRIFCKDGFNISVQVNRTNYCGSENGVRTFGLDWKLVEWGFPSEHIDGKKYNAESSPTTESVGGYVEIGLLDELCTEHGGIDLNKTLQEAMLSE